MPNTLAHIALQGTLFSAFKVPVSAILAGCLIPDVPWILRRALRFSGQTFDPIALEGYFLAQGSLFISLCMCVASGLFFKQWRSASLFVAIGAVCHLCLDALQEKWGNGVHLFAPFDWTHFQFGIIEVETPLVYGITIAGLVPILLWVKKIPAEAQLLDVTAIKSGCAGCLLMAYLVLPFAYVGAVVDSNSRDLQTLAEVNQRVGKEIELDREQVTVDKTSNTMSVTTHTGEDLSILSNEIDSGGVYSIRGVFIATETIRVAEWVKHTGMRDFASYFGVGFIVLWLMVVGWFRFRYDKD